MTILRTYRKILAVVLLAVYAFIATPVQTWHHHKVAGKATKDFTVLSKADDKTDANCPVCSHKYSTYNEIALVSFEASLPFIPSLYDGYLPQRVAASVVSLPNKGPPVVR